MLLQLKGMFCVFASVNHSPPVRKYLFFHNLTIVLLYGCVTVQNVITNLIDYKKVLYALYTMINNQPFICCSRKTNHGRFITGIFNTSRQKFLATEVKIGISPVIMTEISKFCDNATNHLRSGQVLERRYNRTNHFGVESILKLGTKIRVLVLENLKQSSSLNSFKQGVKVKPK